MLDIVPKRWQCTCSFTFGLLLISVAIAVHQHRWSQFAGTVSAVVLLSGFVTNVTLLRLTSASYAHAAFCKVCSAWRLVKLCFARKFGLSWQTKQKSRKRRRRRAAQATPESEVEPVEPQTNNETKLTNTCATNHTNTLLVLPTLHDFRAALCYQCSLSISDFEPKFDMEYEEHTHLHKRRGEEKYFVPSAEWKKLALSVVGKYEDDEWLRKSMWPVVYHGTSATEDVVKGIVREGFKIRGGCDKALHGERYGPGIYCSPYIEKAVIYSNVPLHAQGSEYSIVFQCRVRPKEYSKVIKHVWLVEDEMDIRPCGILLRRFLLPDKQRIKYSDVNPYGEGTHKWRRYEQIRNVACVREARSLGRDLTGLQKDFARGLLTLCHEEKM